MPAEGALSGLKVLELGQAISAPYCACLLAGYGAEVIKIEPPGEGDPARKTGPFFRDIPHHEGSGSFLYLNTRKKGITLNLETRAGVDIFKQLVKGADILVENFPPEVMPGLGLSYETLERENPALVMVSITPFGQTGPYRDFESTNLTALAMGGIMSLTGEPDREPLKNAGFQAEYQGGLYAFAAATIVSFGAMMTGLGQHVDVSLMECMASGLEGSLPFTAYLGAEHNRHRGGNRFSPIIGVYPCRDGYVGVHANAREWPMVAKGIGRPELIDDPRFSTASARRENRDELEALIMGWTTQHTKKEIYEIASRVRAPFAPVLTVGELPESPHLKARDFFVEIDHPHTGPIIYPGAPFKMSETPWQIGRAPLLGEHNQEIYCERLGYAREDLVRLRRQGVI
ncbi:MAG: CoA transferase [Chloroflexi bacterium]|nr:CoA transferase [Chloroflexota bacterium]